MAKQKMLTSTQIAEMCGVTSRTVTRWIKRGYFPGAWKAPGRNNPYHVPEEDVVAFVERMSADLAEQRPAEAAALTEVLHRARERQPPPRYALIVEDDVDAGAIFEFTLRTAGFNPVVVESGERALSLMASMVPDVVVLDLHLPDLPGTEVLRRMRASAGLAQVPVIVATAHPQMAEEIQEMADGSTELAEVLILIKPVRYDMLQTRAAQLAGK